MRRRRPPHVNAPTPCDRGDVRPPGCPASIPGVEVAGGTRARLRVTADGLQALAGRCATLAGELSAAVAPSVAVVSSCSRTHQVTSLRHLTDVARATSTGRLTNPSQARHVRRPTPTTGPPAILRSRTSPSQAHPPKSARALPRPLVSGALLNNYRKSTNPRCISTPSPHSLPPAPLHTTHLLH